MHEKLFARLARLALHEPGTGVLGDGHREVLDQLQRSRLKIETRKTSFRTCLSEHVCLNNFSDRPNLKQLPGDSWNLN